MKENRTESSIKQWVRESLEKVTLNSKDEK